MNKILTWTTHYVDDSDSHTHVHMMGLQDVHRPAPFTTEADRTGLKGLCAVLPWHNGPASLLPTRWSKKAVPRF